MVIKKFALPMDAARILNCSKGTVHALVDRGELPSAGRTVRGVRVLRLEDVEKYAQRKRADAEGEPAE